MKYEDLVEIMGPQRWFEFATLVQLTDERRASLQVQLHRWCRTGKLLRLRRGAYALPERYRKRPLPPTELANRLYAPSYLSMHWALGFYGMIPEHVPHYTSITRRKPATFENDFGIFVYRNIKAGAFFGYRGTEIAGVRVQIAEPEKALLDLWHLEKGPWDRLRMAAMRFQAFEMVDPQRLEEYAGRFRSARLESAVRVWLELSAQQDEGVEL
jgi:predicted transcriptional regulator of viral defense system